MLEVDPVNKRMTMTLKPALMTSKLPIIASLQQAAPGAKAHGVVTGMQVGQGRAGDRGRGVWGGVYWGVGVWKGGGGRLV